LEVQHLLVVLLNKKGPDKYIEASKSTLVHQWIGMLKERQVADHEELVLALK
jgi:hypothetical protein